MQEQQLSELYDRLELSKRVFQSEHLIPDGMDVNRFIAKDCPDKIRYYEYKVRSGVFKHDYTIRSLRSWFVRYNFPERTFSV